MYLTPLKPWLKVAAWHISFYPEFVVNAVMKNMKDIERDLHIASVICDKI